MEPAAPGSPGCVALRSVFALTCLPLACRFLLLVAIPLKASGFMQLREITGKRMILTHLSNHTLGVIITVHDISHLGVKITSL